MSGFPLSILIWLPVAVALAAVLAPRALAARVVLLGSLVTLGLAIALAVGIGPGGKLHNVTDTIWISGLGVHYKLGLDGLNVFLVLIATIIFAAAIGWANRSEWERPKVFYFWLALGESAVLGAFCAQDLILFVAFFDLMLIPFYFLTGQWGGRRRVPATTKLVIYTLVGSLLMLAAAIATGVLAQPDGGTLSFAFSDLRAHILPTGSQEWIFLLFAAAFLVKMPAFPVHGWMPDAYRAMPLPVLAVFSAVLSKVAAYGFLRIVLPLYPNASAHFQTLLLLIALASVLYGSAMAFTTTDSRLVLGFSSVAQLGFITMGIFSLRAEGAQGALLQMINHAVVVAPLFFIVALLAARAGGSEDLRDMGGIAFRAPVFAAIFLIVALANLAMPGSSNFIGEFLILLGVFRAKLVIAVIAVSGVALASVYTLRWFIRTMHNRRGERVESHEVAFADGALLVPLVLVILALAVYPQVALRVSDDAAKRSVRTVDLVQHPRAPVSLGTVLPPNPTGSVPQTGSGTPGTAPPAAPPGAVPPSAGGGGP